MLGSLSPRPAYISVCILSPADSIRRGEFLCLLAADGTRIGVTEKPVTREMPREARISRTTASSLELNCLASPALGQPGAGQTLSRRRLPRLSIRWPSRKPGNPPTDSTEAPKIEGVQDAEPLCSWPY